MDVIDHSSTMQEPEQEGQQLKTFLQGLERRPSNQVCLLCLQRSQVWFLAPKSGSSQTVVTSVLGHPKPSATSIGTGAHTKGGHTYTHKFKNES